MYARRRRRCRTMSSSCGRSATSTLCRELAHHLRGAAAISPIVSFLTRSPMSSAAIMHGRQFAAHDLARTAPASRRGRSRGARCGAAPRRGDCMLDSLQPPSLAPLRARVRSRRMAVHGSACCRKFFSIAWPCSVRIDSGWNCTPSTGKRPVTHPHDFAVVGPGGDLEAVGQRGALDRERVVTRRRERRGQLPLNTPSPVCAMASVLPCMSALRRAPPCRRRRGRSPGGRGTRRGSACVAPKRSITASEMPASVGVHGPGDMQMRSRRQARDLVQRNFVVAGHVHVFAEFAEVLDEVVGEAVVVVDHQQHGDSTLSSTARSGRCPAAAAAV